MNVVSDRIANEMTGELASRREFLHTVSEAIEQNMADDRRNMELSGATNMLHYPEYADLNKAKNFLATVEGRDSLYNMMRRASSLEFTFTIGAENEDKLVPAADGDAAARLGAELLALVDRARREGIDAEAALAAATDAFIEKCGKNP